MTFVTLALLLEARPELPVECLRPGFLAMGRINVTTMVMKTTTCLADISRLTLEASPCEVKQCWRLSDLGALRLSTD